MTTHLEAPLKLTGLYPLAVAAFGSIVLPMASLGRVPVWKPGLHLPSAMASLPVTDTRNNAIDFGMGRVPETGKRTVSGFFLSA